MSLKAMDTCFEGTCLWKLEMRESDYRQNSLILKFLRENSHRTLSSNSYGDSTILSFLIHEGLTLVGHGVVEDSLLQGLLELADLS